MATFYLICFVVGFAFSVLSLLGGVGRLHLPGHLHWPHGALHHGGGIGHAAPAHAGHLGGHGGAGRAGAAAQVSFFNFFTLMAFLAWFGGTGYLLTRYSSFWFLLALALASLSGLAGASVVFWFFAKVLLAHDTYLDAADFELVGAIGRVGSPILPGGTGEIIFPQAGARRVSGARSEDGKPVERGAEVVITRYERGIAYVRRWEDLTTRKDSDQ